MKFWLFITIVVAGHCSQLLASTKPSVSQSGQQVGSMVLSVPLKVVCQVISVQPLTSRSLGRRVVLPPIHEAPPPGTILHALQQENRRLEKSRPQQQKNGDTVDLQQGVSFEGLLTQNPPAHNPLPLTPNQGEIVVLPPPPPIRIAFAAQAPVQDPGCCDCCKVFWDLLCKILCSDSQSSS